MEATARTRFFCWLAIALYLICKSADGLVAVLVGRRTRLRRAARARACVRYFGFCFLKKAFKKKKRKEGNKKKRRISATPLLVFEF